MNPDNIPERLRRLNQWVLWKTATRDGKPTKLPYQINGQLASSTDPATWAPFDAVVRQTGADHGFGFVFGPDDPFCGIDLDGCRDPKTGKVAEWARQIILEVDSYSEVSPSQTGVKIFIRGEMPDCRHKVPYPADPVCSKQPGIEVYDQARYFAVTAIRLRGVSTDAEHRQDALTRLCEAHMSESAAQRQREDKEASRLQVIERARRYIGTIPGAISGQSGHNQTFHVACVLLHGFSLTKSESLILLSEYNQRCEPTWTEKELRHKIDSADKQPGARGYLRDTNPSQWESLEVPTYTDPTPPTPAKTNTSPIRITTLKQATDDYLDIIESGQHQLVELGIPLLDYAIGGGVENGEMVIVAARPSHGKSAFALQLIHNMSSVGLSCAMVSEEMSKLALAKRAVQYAANDPQEHWQTSMDTVRADMATHWKYREKCYVIEGCGSAENVAAEIRKLADQGVKVAAIDYAQLLTSKGKGRYEQVTHTSVTLRQLANQTGIVLIVLCQLGRAIENRQKFAPAMHDLKESGQLEQDADVILFLVWPHFIDKKKPAKEYQIWVGKNRNRPINERVCDFEFEPSRQRVVEPRPVYQREVAFDAYNERGF